MRKSNEDYALYDAETDEFVDLFSSIKELALAADLTAKHVSLLLREHRTFKFRGKRVRIYIIPKEEEDD